MSQYHEIDAQKEEDGCWKTVKAKCVAFITEYPRGIEFVKHVVTAVVAFVLGYFALKAQVNALQQTVTDLHMLVDDSRQTLSDLSSAINPMQISIERIGSFAIIANATIQSIVRTVDAMNLTSLQTNVDAASSSVSALLGDLHGLSENLTISMKDLENVKVDKYSIIQFIQTNVSASVIPFTKSHLLSSVLGRPPGQHEPLPTSSSVPINFTSILVTTNTTVTLLQPSIRILPTESRWYRLVAGITYVCFGQRGIGLNFVFVNSVSKEELFPFFSGQMSDSDDFSSTIPMERVIHLEVGSEYFFEIHCDNPPNPSIGCGLDTNSWFGVHSI